MMLARTVHVLGLVASLVLGAGCTGMKARGVDARETPAPSSHEAERTVFRDEGPAARWSHPGYDAEGPVNSFSGVEALVGSTLVHWDHGTLEGFDAVTGNRKWTLDAPVGNRECGYPDASIDGDDIVVPAIVGDEDDPWQGQILAVDARTGRVTSTTALGRVNAVREISCAPCVIETVGLDESFEITLNAVDVKSRRVLATRPGWTLLSEVAGGAVLAQLDAQREESRSIALLDALTLRPRWTAEIGPASWGWGSDAAWVIAVSGPNGDVVGLLSLDAEDGHELERISTDQLGPSNKMCLVDEERHLTCVTRASAADAPIRLSVLDASRFETKWTIELAGGARFVDWWHIAHGAVFVAWHDASYDQYVSVFNSETGAPVGDVRMRPGGELTGFADLIVLERDDASMVAYDVSRLLTSVAPVPPAPVGGQREAP